MKLRYSLAIVLALIIAIGISSCSKSPEDKVKSYLTKFYEWIESGDFQKQMEASMSNKQGSQEVLVEKQKQLLKDAGFASEEEFQQELEKIKDDPKIFELTMKIQTASMKAMQPFIEKYQEQLKQGAEQFQDAADSAKEALEKATEEIEKSQEESKTK